MNTLSFSLRRISSAIHRRLGAVWIFSLMLILCGGACAENAEKVAERIKKSTVRVVILAGGQLKGHGSGFIISSQGHVVTNRHVIAEADAAVVVYCQGDRVFFRRAELVVASNTADLAILKIDPIPSTEVVEIATTDPAAGQVVMSVGYPGVLDKGVWATLEGVETGVKSGEGRIKSPEAVDDFIPAVFPGAVAKIITLDGTRLVIHSAKISPGNSGGPLIDAAGRVCGINTLLAPASMAGTDYAFAIHAIELVSLARANSIPIDVTSSKTNTGPVSVPGSNPDNSGASPDIKPNNDHGGSSGSNANVNPGRIEKHSTNSNLQMLLLIAVAALAVVMFLMVLRKPRMLMVDAMSRVVRSKRPASGQAAYRATIPAQASPRAPSNAGTMRLRGRDIQGLSYDIAFNDADFRRCGGRLVIGRNNDLSQLLLSHDSVSRQHATLSLSGGAVHVEDRNSGNGTKVNGRELTVGSPPCPLQPGDRLSLGEVDLMFEILN